MLLELNAKPEPLPFRSNLTSSPNALMPDSDLVGRVLCNLQDSRLLTKDAPGRFLGAFRSHASGVLMLAVTCVVDLSVERIDDEEAAVHRRLHTSTTVDSSICERSLKSTNIEHHIVLSRRQRSWFRPKVQAGDNVLTTFFLVGIQNLLIISTRAITKIKSSIPL